MADQNFPLTADEDIDDLPRTLRRERAARERQAREREAEGDTARAAPAPELSNPVDPGYAPQGYIEDDAYPAVVQRFDVPFFHMMAFFLKAVLAGIPALILLGAIVWGIGEILQSFFPWLIKMQIVILFPET